MRKTANLHNAGTEKKGGWQQFEERTILYAAKLDQSTNFPYGKTERNSWAFLGAMQLVIWVHHTAIRRRKKTESVGSEASLPLTCRVQKTNAGISYEAAQKSLKQFPGLNFWSEMNPVIVDCWLSCHDPSEGVVFSASKQFNRSLARRSSIKLAQ